MNPQDQPAPNDQYAQLKSAVLGGQQQGGGLNIIGNSPQLAQLYGAQGLNPTSEGSQQVSGAAYNADLQAKAAKAAAAEAVSRQQDMLDPSKYRVIPLNDGGFDFVAPNGQKISASQYAQISGKTEADILKLSTNPIDISYRQDYNNLQKYINNKISSKGDPNSDAAKQARAIEAKVKQQYGVDLSKANISDVLQSFQAAYPTVYGGTNKGVSVGQTFIPSQQYGQANQDNFGGNRVGSR